MTDTLEKKADKMETMLRQENKISQIFSFLGSRDHLQFLISFKHHLNYNIIPQVKQSGKGDGDGDGGNHDGCGTTKEPIKEKNNHKNCLIDNFTPDRNRESCEQHRKRQEKHVFGCPNRDIDHNEG